MNDVFLMSFLKLFRPTMFPGKLGLFDRLFGDRLAAMGIREVELESGIVWKLDLDNSPLRWIVYGCFVPGLIPWAKKHIPEDGVVVDSGANIGQIALYLGQYASKGRYLAFEPGTHQADWLEACVNKNKHILPSIEIYRLGLSDTQETVYLKDCGGASTHGGHSIINDSEGERVEVVMLDEHLSKLGIDRVDFWKLDMEGHEIFALKGARKLLEKQAVGALYVELYGEKGFEVRRYLKDMGYRCHVFSRRWYLLQPEKEPAFQCNGLFLPE
ncbi:MAG: FkbM family methyltransferase [Magnetococcales bacterium]|nr:FkbM family methyltransferase [Magnetococcales bacterium]